MVKAHQIGLGVPEAFSSPEAVILSAENNADLWLQKFWPVLIFKSIIRGLPVVLRSLRHYTGFDGWMSLVAAISVSSFLCFSLKGESSNTAYSMELAGKIICNP